MRDAFLDRVRPRLRRRRRDRRPARRRSSELVKGWADAVWLQGERFGTVGCEKDGERFEITTFRAEVYRRDSRKPEVTFSDDIETDLSRRDFTINAMAIALDAARSSSIRTTARTTSSPAGCARRSRPRSRSATTRCGCCARRASWRRSASSPMPTLVARDRADARAPEDHQRGARSATSSRSCWSPTIRRPGLWLMLAHGPRRRVPARAQRDAARAGPDPPAQGRARAHDRGRRQDVAAAAAPALRAAARRRQAAARAATGRRA